MPTSAHACDVVRSNLGATTVSLVLDVGGLSGFDESSEEEKEKDTSDEDACVSVLSHRIDGSALSDLFGNLSLLLSVAFVVEDADALFEEAEATKEGA